MGRSKTKKQKAAPEPPQIAELVDVEIDSSIPVKAIDGHSTQGWTDSEVKAYNELIVERQKLEKQRHELEEKCAKSQTQRALLHENVANIDTIFRAQKTMSGLGMFKFTGLSTCCVDLETHGSCHHEVCKRAKTEGITDFELDTIKYYSMRITTEKSDRIRNALRKQRDLELIRIRKEEEDGQAQMTKKSSKRAKSIYADVSKLNGRNSRSKDVSRAAKETEKIVNKIINQLDDLRSDLQTGKISAEEAQGKLNILDSKLPAIQDKSNPKTMSDSGSALGRNYDNSSITSAFQSHLREKLLSAKGDTLTQAFSIMDHFLSATKPDDLQVAITELKDVLQLSGPMCDEIQNSLGALEGIFDNPDKLSFTGPDGKQECSSIIDLMDKLKETLRRTGQLPDGANASLNKVFQECIDLETEATTDLARKCEDGSIASADLPTALLRLKEDFVSRSPIPPLTSKMLSAYIEDLIDAYDARQLLVKAETCAKVAELEAHITSLVISRTQKQSVKYLERLQRLSKACKDIGAVEESEKLRKVFDDVSVRMRDWVAASNAKKPKQHNAHEHGGAERKHALVSTPTSAESNASVSAPNTNSKIHSLVEQLTSLSEGKEIDISQETVREMQGLVKRGGKKGIWRTFDKLLGPFFQIDNAMIEKAESYGEKTRSMIEDQSLGVRAAICSLYQLKLCPGLTAVLISQALVQIADTSEDNCRLHMRQLSTCMKDLPHPISAEWCKVFQYLALAMEQLYVAVYIESLASFPELSAIYIAVSTMEMMTKYAVLTRTQQRLRKHQALLLGWLALCFGQDIVQKPSGLHQAIALYVELSFDDEFKCTTTGPCTKHMSFTRMLFNPKPKQFNVLDTGVENMTRRAQSISRSNDSTIAYEEDKDTAMHPHLTSKGQRSTMKPRKTLVKYPPNHESETMRMQSVHNADVRMVGTLKNVALLHESTAKKALAILQCRAEDYATQKILPPTELFDAMNHILNSVGDDYYHPIDHIKEREVVASPITSKFSEHLDEPQPSRQITVREVLRLQNTFKQLRTGVLGEEYLESVVDDATEFALSGRFPSPDEAIFSYINRAAKIGEIPDCFKNALAQARTDITTIMDDPAGRYEFETRRLRYLLGSVGAVKPSIPALLQLALTDSDAFSEYYQVILDKLEETNAEMVESLEKAWANTLRLTKSKQLRMDSPCLNDLVEHAIADWSLRPEDITNYVCENQDDQSVTINRDDLDTVVVQGIVKLSNGPATILKSPAKQAVVEKRSSKASAVASRATISSSEEPLSPSEGVQTTHKEGKLDMNTEFINSQTETGQQHDKKGTTSAKLDSSLCDQPDSVTAAIDGNGVHLGRKNSKDNTSQDTLEADFEDATPPYLLLGLESVSKGTPTSMPASFRLLDMMKSLASLQRKIKDVLETAGEITRIDKAHGEIVQMVSQNLGTQVDIYSDLIRRIAVWNGVELAREGFLDP